MAEEDAFCVLKVKADGSELAQRSGRANEITTTKYTLLTWLPVSFLYQFRRVGECISVAMLALIAVVLTLSLTDLLYVFLGLHPPSSLISHLPDDDSERLFLDHL